MSKYLTIPGFSKLSRQKIFDMAVAHIASTRVKSYNENAELCSYAGSGCNAAPFIREDGREFADKQGAWLALVEMKLVPDHNAGFLGDLQDAHDGCRGANFMEEWKRNMLSVAQKYKLDDIKLF